MNLDYVLTEEMKKDFKKMDGTQANRVGNAGKVENKSTS